MQTMISQRKAAVLPSVLAEVLPLRLCRAIEKMSPELIEEVRLHADRQTTLTCFGENLFTGIVLSGEEMQEILKKMCTGSLYAYAESICQGYLCMPNGIRVGICGSAATEGGRIIGVHAPTGLNVRIPHRIAVNADPLMPYLQARNGKGMLIYAPPGVGKTTLLREIARRASSTYYGFRTVVIDTREELFYSLDGQELALDILRGYPKGPGIEIAVQSMGAELIVCDEISSQRDAQEILCAAGRGVPLIASVHAASLEELLKNPTIGPLCVSGVFSSFIGLSRRRKSFFYKIDLWEELARKQFEVRATCDKSDS